MIGNKVLFQPAPPSRAREVGTVTAVNGTTLTIAWDGQSFEREAGDCIPLNPGAQLPQ